MSDPLMLEYDFQKHLSTLALISLGGVIALGQSDTTSVALIISAAAITISGVLAIATMSSIVAQKHTGKSWPRMFRFTRLINSAPLAFGLGLFIAAFLRGS